MLLFMSVTQVGVDSVAAACCQGCAASRVDTPPPDSDQAYSVGRVPSPTASLVKSVPPTPTTQGEEAGYSTPGTAPGTPLETPLHCAPLSPEETNIVRPSMAAFCRAVSYADSSSRSWKVPNDSHRPKEDDACSEPAGSSAHAWVAASVLAVEEPGPKSNAKRLTAGSDTVG